MQFHSPLILPHRQYGRDVRLSLLILVLTAMLWFLIGLVEPLQ